jgi:hypothetical protein
MNDQEFDAYVRQIGLDTRINAAIAGSSTKPETQADPHIPSG